MSKVKSGSGNGMYGRKHSEETLAKMRAARAGSVPWNKGKKTKPHSEETKAKMRAAQQARRLAENL